jgi:phytoene dehydrogenase-like protein
VRTAELTAPGFRNDLFSAFYPMTAASPVMQSLDLGDHGLRWSHAPAVLGHPRIDRDSVLLHRRVDDTVRSIGGERDGERYRWLHDEWLNVGSPMLDALLAPFPPIRRAARLLARAGSRGIATLGRRALVPVRRFIEEEFDDEGAGLLYAGNALHADLTPDSAGSALFGWMLVGLAQQVGFPVPCGGAAAMTDALIARLQVHGGSVQCSQRVEAVVVRTGRAVGVRTADGSLVTARRAVIADCDAAALYLQLVGADLLPPRFVGQIARIERSQATFKVDWALRAPVPWLDDEIRKAGTVHIADGLDELTMTSAQLANGLVPDQPFLLIGQMTTADATRSPAGTESLWAYTHVPQQVRGDAGRDGLTGVWDEREQVAFAERIEGRIEDLAPGFRDSVLARHVMSPSWLERNDSNLVGGDISGGSARLHQQLIFRPVLGWARAETPIKSLFLGSASAHPGGAVHGACGANAARAAFVHDRFRLTRG